MDVGYWLIFATTVVVLCSTVFGVGVISWLLTGWPDMPKFMGIKNDSKP